MFRCDCFLRLFVEFYRNPSEFSWMKIPVYDLHLIPLYVILFLQKFLFGMNGSILPTGCEGGLNEK